MNNFRVVAASMDHVEELAPRLRAADRAEVYAASGVTPLAALTFSLERSDIAMAVEFDGRAEIMFGAGTINVLAGIGAPWLLGSDMIEREYRHFLRGSIWWRNRLLKRYPVLRNMVDDRNIAARRWLAWLGFRLSEPVCSGFENRPFRFFELRASDV